MEILSDEDEITEEECENEDMEVSDKEILSDDAEIVEEESQDLPTFQM